MHRWLLLACVALGGCVDGQGKPVSEPEFLARNVKGYAETATGLPPEVVYGWDLGVAGEVASWRECTAVDTCGRVERTRPKDQLLGFERVAVADVEGQPVEVMKLSLAPRRGYIVPTWKR